MPCESTAKIRISAHFICASATEAEQKTANRRTNDTAR